MKNLIIALMIVFSVSLAGGICMTLSNLNGVSDEVKAYSEKEQFPMGISNIIINPMTAVLIY